MSYKNASFIILEDNVAKAYLFLNYSLIWFVKFLFPVDGTLKLTIQSVTEFTLYYAVLGLFFLKLLYGRDWIK